MKNKQIFIDTLREAVFEKFSDPDLINAVKDKLVSNGRFARYEFLHLQAYPYNLRALSDSQYIHLAQAVNDYAPFTFDMDKFFSEGEIDRATEDSIHRAKFYNVRTFSGASPLGPKVWICTASIAQIAVMMNENILNLYFDVQKEINEEKKRSALSRKLIRHIEQSLVDDTYIYTTLKINVHNGGHDQTTYFPSNHTIVLNNEAYGIVAEGCNCAAACERAYLNNLEQRELFHNRFFPIMLTSLDSDGLEKMMNQRSVDWRIYL